MKRLSIHEAQNELNLIVADSNMQALYHRIYHLAAQSPHLLLLGDSGCGKDLVAQFIHRVGTRSQHPFVSVNCSSIPEALFESEMFGYLPGAFSEALSTGKKGLIETANHGILFLDEIGELSLANQVKLLHFLQSGEIRPLGAQKDKKLDVQIISATNRDLHRQIRQKQFRQDLYYRICVISLEIPPLHERPQDIMALAQHFLLQYAADYGTHKTLTSDALRYLCSQQWSGNVRQLQNYIQRLCLLETPAEIESRYLECVMPVQTLSSESQEPAHSAVIPLEKAMAVYEKQYIQQVLSQAATLEQAAHMLDIPLATLNRKKKKYLLYKYPRYIGETAE